MRATTPLGQGVERYFDSLLASWGGIGCLDGNESSVKSRRHLELLRSELLSWKIGLRNAGYDTWDMGYGAAIVRDRIDGDEFVLLAVLFARRPVGAQRGPWMGFGTVFDGPVMCVRFPAAQEDRRLVSGLWDDFLGNDPRADSSGINPDAWDAFLGFAPPFDAEDYWRLDPDLPSHP